MQCFLKSKCIKAEISMVKIGELLRKIRSNGSPGDWRCDEWRLGSKVDILHMSERHVYPSHQMVPRPSAGFGAWMYPSHQMVHWLWRLGSVCECTPLTKWFPGYAGWVLCVNVPLLPNASLAMTAGFCVWMYPSYQMLPWLWRLGSVCECTPLTKWFPGYDGWVLCVPSYQMLPWLRRLVSNSTSKHPGVYVGNLGWVLFVNSPQLSNGFSAMKAVSCMWIYSPE